MFKFTSKYILDTALVVFAYASGIASAAPPGLEARQTDIVTITLCIDYNYGHCIPFPAVIGACNDFTGGISGYNHVVSSAKIPVGFSCTFYRDFACLIGADSDARPPDDVKLAGGDYPNFGTLPGLDGITLSFNDASSSFSCIRATPNAK